MGGRSEFVITGSDNGRLIVWQAATGQVVSVLRGGSKAVRRVKVRLWGCKAGGGAGDGLLRGAGGGPAALSAADGPALCDEGGWLVVTVVDGWLLLAFAAEV
jgi:hypothetical protein